ncbi:SprT family protein [Alkalicoccus luteus]|uniref:Protein SprT-like n=1 Tax=Alkalicoccus luteus TaxID=1237094 RepID=A0A969PQR8_9BACI|nr:SprT family protein [Alkalicoccus luteus]NJP38690.1 SprT family protein [Alkalicoccus luteus]
MTNNELQLLTEQISIEYFSKPFRHRAFFNNRLRTTGGRYALHSHHIEINPGHLEYYGKDELISIIKHELCHYHLHLEGRGYQHRDAEFKALLQKVGGSRHCRSLPGARQVSSIVHVYECASCRFQYPRRRRMNTDKYVCGKCRGTLKKITEKKLQKSLTSLKGM